MNQELDELRQEMRTASGSLYYCQNQLEQIQRESEEHRKRLSEELEQLRDELKEWSLEQRRETVSQMGGYFKLYAFVALFLFITLKDCNF